MLRQGRHEMGGKEREEEEATAKTVLPESKGGGYFLGEQNVP